MKTRFLTKEQANASRKWVLVDASNVPLGRLASQVASVLRGKNKPTFAPHNDCGDFVIVINASQVKLTGNKLENKKYYQHSGYIGGLKETPLSAVMERHPERIIETAVKGMLPKGPLGYAMIKKLKVYPAAEHPHSAQSPKLMTLN